MRLVAALAVGLLLTAVPASAQSPGPPTASLGPAIGMTEVLSGFTRPVVVTHDAVDADRLYIAEQAGRVQEAVREGTGWRISGTFLDLTALVNDPTQPDRNSQGLLGLAFHPDHASNGLLYVHYTRRADGAGDGDSVIAEYRRQPGGAADPESRRVLMVIRQPYEIHNGGQLVFGPDGLLYIGMGDGGGKGDPRKLAQDPGSLLGKMLRIDPADPDGADGPAAYAVPADNPFVGQDGVRPEIWSVGLREPWRFTIDQATGDLVTGDVGQYHYEEVDWSRGAGTQVGGRAANYGWSVCEGDRRYPSGTRCAHARLGFEAPVFSYRHQQGDGPMDGGAASSVGSCTAAPGRRRGRVSTCSPITAAASSLRCAGAGSSWR